MVGNVSGFNSMNDDFMYQQYMKSLQNTQGTQQTQQQTQATDSTSFQGRGNVDTFERSGNSNGLILAGLGTVGAVGAGYYYANPFEKGELFKNDFIAKANEEFLAKEKIELFTDKKLEYVKKQYKANTKLSKGNEITDEAIKAIRKYLGEEKLTKLEEQAIADVGFNTKKGNFSPKALNTFIEKTVTPVMENDADKIAKDIQKALDAKDYTKLQQELTNNKAAKALIEGLDDKAKVADIEKLIKENPKAFGITAKTEVDIANEAKNLAKGQTKANFKSALETAITDGTTNVKKAKDTLNSKLISQWDDTAKAFKKDAPEAFSKGLKNFKWKTAGKWAAIAAGAGILLNWAFGGSNKA